MRRPWLLWTTLALVYALLRLWYDGGGGPLTPDEIARHVATLERQGFAADQVAAMRAFMEGDDGEDFVMANFIHLREQPLAIAGVQPGESAQATLDRYLAHLVPVFLLRACHPVLLGPVTAAALDLWGIENAAAWSQVALVRYRTRRDAVEIATDPAFADAHAYKVAAMLQTIAVPVAPSVQLGSPRWTSALVLALIGTAIQLALRRRHA